MDSAINSRSRIKTAYKQSSIFFNPYQDIGLAIGKKMSGKSYALKKLLAPVNRVIVWDYNHEHKDKLIVHELSTLNAVWRENRFSKRIAFQPYDRTPEAFEAFLNWVYNNAVYVCLVIEEVRIYTLQNRAPKILFTLLDTGRHIPKIGVWCTSRRAKGVTVDIPYNADHILVFKMQRPEDIKYMGEFMDSDLVEALREKPPYYFAYYNGKDGETEIHKPL